MKIFIKSNNNYNILSQIDLRIKNKLLSLWLYFFLCCVRDFCCNLLKLV